MGLISVVGSSERVRTCGIMGNDLGCYLCVIPPINFLGSGTFPFIVAFEKSKPGFWSYSSCLLPLGIAPARSSSAFLAL